jgi:FdhE protein
VTELQGAHPEWSPYLALVSLVLEEAKEEVWNDAVPPPGSGQPGQPMLAGTVIRLPRRVAERWVRDAVRMAAAHSDAARPLLEATGTGRLDAGRLFEAAVAGTPGPLRTLGAEAEVGVGILEALTPLIGMPLWQACGRAWADRTPAGWRHGHCPICGAWPALAELRGLENRRRFRCGLCGADWGGDLLWCPFCGTDDHARLDSLVLPDRCDTRRVDVCRACQGYIKTITTLSPTAPREVLLRDLATLVLDAAALDQGYRRPPRLPQAATRVEFSASRLSARLWRHA